jgi:acetamidase/formamidase
MATHRLKPTAYHNVLGTRPPDLTVASGDTVIVPTLDAAGFDHLDKRQASGPNPMSGPIFVEGAAPGDALRVDIVRMTTTRKTGWTRAGLAPNVVDPASIHASVPARRNKALWNINKRAGTVRLADPPAALRDWVLPLSPMIGCFGVAPAMGQAFSTATSAENGGNMDYRLFGPGTTVWFPVFAPGALFFLGDCHACQGDGEIVGTGIETSYEVEVTLTVEKDRPLGWPRAETADDIITIGNARPLDQALQHATSEMVRWLAADFGLDRVAAAHLLGQVVRYDVGNVYDPAYTMACRVAKRWLPAKKGGRHG